MEDENTQHEEERDNGGREEVNTFNSLMMERLGVAARQTSNDFDGSEDIGEPGSHLARARESTVQTPSPFLLQMVQAADRIAQGPELDLAGNLRAHSLAASHRSGSRTRPERSTSRNSQRLEDSRERSNGNVAIVHNSRALPELSRPPTSASSLQPSSLRAENETTERGNGSSSIDLFEESDNGTASTDVYRTSQRSSSSTRERTSRVDRNSLAERSSEVRRGLERAIRDYRIARRALRTQTERRNIAAGQRPSASHQDNEPDDVESMVQSIAILAGIDESAIAVDSPMRDTPLSQRNVSAGESTTPSDPRLAAARLRAARLSMQQRTDEIGAYTDRLSVPDYDRPTESSPANSRLLDTMENLREIRRHWPSSDINTVSNHARTRSSRDLVNPSVRPAELNADSRRRLDATLLRNRVRNHRVEDTPSRKRAKTTIQYLSRLIKAERSPCCTVELAQNMEIDSLTESLENGVVHDLPLRMDELPTPSSSSWLENGVSWSGEQISGNRRLFAALALELPEERAWADTVAGERIDNVEQDLNAQVRRHSERLRRARHSRVLGTLGETDLDSGSSRLDRPPRIESSDLADMERHLSDLLEDEEQRRDNIDDDWIMPETLLDRQRSRPTGNTPVIAEDRWPVKVVFHSVDWNTMKVMGTMSASQLPDRNKPNIHGDSNATEASENNSMESFFDGEIIDFRNHELETVGKKQGYKIGGLGIDVQYWAGIGPFREEVEKHTKAIRYQKAMCRIYPERSESDNREAVLKALKSGLPNEGTVIDDYYLNQKESGRAVDEAMIQCLGSKKWMDEKLSKEWVLMRWKERCFVTSTETTNYSETTQASSESQSRPNRPPNPSASTMYHETATWGLTISGFYYIALHRSTGKIEGLYYDPGSQPYQRLEMWPTDNSRQDSKVNSSHSKSDVPATGSREKDDVIGIRRCFPSMEFR